LPIVDGQKWIMNSQQKNLNLSMADWPEERELSTGIFGHLISELAVLLNYWQKVVLPAYLQQISCFPVLTGFTQAKYMNFWCQAGKR
jgi:hypothetical protein